VRQELAAEAVLRAGAAHQPGDVREADGGRNLLTRADRLGQGPDPGVRDGGDADVGRRAGGGVGRDLCSGAGQGVEHRRLAGVRQPDDADLEVRHQESAR
jgi:hypothetical protein